MSRSHESKDIAPDPISAAISYLGLVKPNKEGMCLGLSYLAASAIVLEELDVYKERIKTIYEPTFLGKFIAMQQEHTHTDMEAFLQSVYVLQDPSQSRLADFFPQGAQPKAQDTLAGLPLVMPLKLEKLGGLSQVAQTDGVYSEGELEFYFKHLQAALLEHKFNHPMAFILEGSDHAIAIGYSPKNNSWVVVDPKKFPNITTVNNPNSLAKEVFASFPENKKVIVTTRINVGSSYKAEAEKVVNAWLSSKQHGLFGSSLEKIHKTSAEKATFIDAQGGSWLYSAARNGDTSKMAELLKLGANPNPDDKYSNKKIPLQVATLHRNYEAVKLLLDNGADPNLVQRGYKGFLNPIFFAISNNDNALLKLLLQHKANPNDQSKKGVTALQFAAQLGHNEAITLLINYQAEKNKSGKSVLAAAIENGHVSTVKHLLDLGVTPSRDLLEKARSTAATKDIATLLESSLMKKADQPLLEQGAKLNPEAKDDALPPPVITKKPSR